MTLKAFDRVGRQVMLHPPSLGAEPERNTGRIAEAFDRVTTYIHRTEGELLQSSEDIIAAVLSHAPLIAQTQFETDRYIASLEYPIKTINASERDNIYQTDTGPVLFPDLSREPDSLIEGMDLAPLPYQLDMPQRTVFRGATRGKQRVNNGRERTDCIGARLSHLPYHVDQNSPQFAQCYRQTKVGIKLTETLLQETLHLIERQTPHLYHPQPWERHGAITVDFKLITLLHASPQEDIEIVPWPDDVIGSHRDIGDRCKCGWDTRKQVIAKLA